MVATDPWCESRRHHVRRASREEMQRLHARAEARHQTETERCTILLPSICTNNICWLRLEKVTGKQQPPCKEQHVLHKFGLGSVRIIRTQYDRLTPGASRAF
jgi:hypothetical protein